MRGFGDLLRIGRRHQDLGQQLIRIERDRRHQLIDLLPRVMRRRRIERRRRLAAGRRCLRQANHRRDQQQRQNWGYQPQSGEGHLDHRSHQLFGLLPVLRD